MLIPVYVMFLRLRNINIIRQWWFNSPVPLW